MLSCCCGCTLQSNGNLVHIPSRRVIEAEVKNICLRLTGSDPNTTPTPVYVLNAVLARFWQQSLTVGPESRILCRRIDIKLHSKPSHSVNKTLIVLSIVYAFLNAFFHWAFFGPAFCLWTCLFFCLCLCLSLGFRLCCLGLLGLHSLGLPFVSGTASSGLPWFFLGGLHFSSVTFTWGLGLSLGTVRIFHPKYTAFATDLWFLYIWFLSTWFLSSFALLFGWFLVFLTTFRFGSWLQTQLVIPGHKRSCSTSLFRWRGSGFLCLSLKMGKNIYFVILNVRIVKDWHLTLAQGFPHW